MPGTSGKGTANSENAAGRRAAADGAKPRYRSSSAGSSVPGAPATTSSSPGAPSRSRVGYAAGRSAARSVFGAVVVDPLPLFRAGAVAALSVGGVPVLGEAAHLPMGIELVERTRATVLLVGGASVTEATQAVSALPSCAVVVLMSQPSRDELVEMLGTGVAGFALRSLTPEELVATVETAASKATSLDGASEPVFMPVLVGVGPGEERPGPAGEEPVFTPKEREILAQLARGASNKRIAEALYVTPATVKTHLAHIYAKLGARGRHEALSHALAMGIVR